MKIAQPHIASWGGPLIGTGKRGHYVHFQSRSVFGTLPQALSWVILYLSPCKAKIALRGQNNLRDVHFMLGNQPAPYRGLSRPPGPKCRKSLENVSRGLRPRGPPKSLQNSPGTLQKKHSPLSGDSPETCRTVPETFLRLFGGPGPEAPRDIFETFSAFRARRARETSVRGGLVPRLLCCPQGKK